MKASVKINLFKNASIMVKINNTNLQFGFFPGPDSDSDCHPYLFNILSEPLVTIRIRRGRHGLLPGRVAS